MADALSPFDPVIATWFRDRVGTPTPIQELAWPVISAGEHVLLSAPTGSGKTLGACLWALDRLLRGAWEPGITRVLYISPLKALGVDVRRNLTAPLAQLAQLLRQAGATPPEIRVEIRSGDTPQRERARMLRHPPEILVTTPESLNLLLTSRGGRSMLGAVETVILDEIHAVADSKRGTWLMSGVERLCALAGEVQRVALSATVRPRATVAEFVGGFENTGPDAYRPRRVRVLEDSSRQRPELDVISTAIPERSTPAEPGAFWIELSHALRPRIARHRSTLVFANGRRLTEKLARYLNDGLAAPIAYAHHGSLSKELRAGVERRLKEGSLPAVVATNSLELGIDIGDCEQVILVQTPRSVASGVQRIGRANHQVGATPRGSLYPTHGHDYLEAAATLPLLRDGAIEALRPVRAPLDVLAQILISMVAGGASDPEVLFDQVRCAWPYRSLTRVAFELVLDMLCGRKGEDRLRELHPLLRRDAVSGALELRAAALPTFYANSGVIPDRGYFTIRLQGSAAKIGELDEEFVWERSLGDTFTIGAQTWRINRIDHNDVVVTPSDKPGAMPPFWRAEAQDRAFEVAEAQALFLEHADGTLKGDLLARELREQRGFDPAAAETLSDYLRRQAEATRGLPHRHRLVIEHCAAEAGQNPVTVIHAAWGGEVLRPWAIALGAAWRERHEGRVSIQSNDDAILVQLPHPVDDGELLGLVDAESVERYLRQGLERTGFFGARFRENAARALLIPRRRLNRRLPLWLSRERAKKLLERVRGLPDFPILAETWRTCLEDCFDLERLRSMLHELRDGGVEVDELRVARPSPFASELVRQQTNDLMYADDVPVGARPSALSQRVLAQVVQDPSLRPALKSEVVDGLRRRLQRTWPGYAPDGAAELLDLLGERLLLPWTQWRELLEACEREHQLEPATLLEETGERALALRLAPRGAWVVAPIAALPRLLHAVGRARDEIELAPLGEHQPDAAAPLSGTLDAALATLLERYQPQLEDALLLCLGEHLTGEGPVEPEELARRFGVPAVRLARSLDELEQEGHLLRDVQLEGDQTPLVCDRENLERGLRLQRAAQRPSLRARPLSQLPLFLATWHGLTAPGDDEETLRAAMEQLFGFPAPAGLWETELLPARLATYRADLLDRLFSEGSLAWFGCGERKISFCFPEARALFCADENDDAEARDQLRALFPDARGRFDLGALASHSGLASGRLTELLWRGVWRGELSSDSLGVLRQAILAGFKASPAQGRSRRRFGGWRATRPFGGAWFLLDTTGAGPTRDALEELEWDKQRARVLLDRYGVLFREQCANELAPLGWRRLLPALRMMELAGELVSGHFFDGLDGLQFASPEAVRLLEAPLDDSAVFLCSACDPVSGCGLGLDLGLALPSRLPSNHLVFHGERLVLSSLRHWEELRVAVPPDHPELPRYLATLERLVTRAFEPRSSVLVKTINGEEAAGSAFCEVLQGAGFKQAYRGLELSKRY